MNYSDEIKTIGDRIASLTALQATELVDYMEIVYGIKAACVPQMAPDNQVPETKEQAKAEPVEFNVELSSYEPDKKIAVIKVVREIMGLGLKEAKELVESAPKPIKDAVSKVDADKLKEQIEAAGAKVTLTGV